MAEHRDGPALRLVVADDHPVVRQGLRALLAAEGDLQVVGEAASGREAVTLAHRLRPDVVLMDLRMPEMDGTAATAAISAALPEVRVLILTTYDADADILRAVEAGAAGYLLKDAPPDQLAAAVRGAARGETVLSPPVAAKLVAGMRSGRQELTRREIDVLALVAEGLSNAEVGRALFIGESTVKTHLLRIFGKLGVTDRTAAVTTAIARGVLSPPGR